MTWEPELEELRQRQALAREMGGPDKIARQRAAGRLTVRERIGALLDSRQLSRDRLDHGQRRLRRNRRIAVDDPDQLSLRPRSHRRPPRRRGRRRFHRARRRVGRIDHREAGCGRADGARTAPAADPPDRRQRRRRFREVARGDGLHLRAVPAGLRAHGPQPRDRAGGEPRPGPDRGLRRRQGRAESLLAAGARPVADVRRRAARRRGRRPEADEGGTRQQPHPRVERRGGRRSGERAGSVRTRASLPQLPALLRARTSPAPADRRRSRAPRGLPGVGRPPRPSRGLSHAPDHRGRRRYGLVLRDRTPAWPLRDHRAWPGSTAGRSP